MIVDDAVYSYIASYVEGGAPSEVVLKYVLSKHNWGYKRIKHVLKELSMPVKLRVVFVDGPDMQFSEAARVQVCEALTCMNLEAVPVKTNGSAVPEYGWVTMSIPSRNNGKPFPVLLRRGEGKLWYQAFESDLECDWSIRSDEWKLHSVDIHAAKMLSAFDGVSGDDLRRIIRLSIAGFNLQRAELVDYLPSVTAWQSKVVP